MADGKVKKYFKNLRKMKEEGVNVPKPKKKAVDGKTNYGINWNKKTKVTTPPTGTGQTTKQKTRPADETRTEPFIQGGIGVTKQGKKPKKKKKKKKLTEVVNILSGNQVSQLGVIGGTGESIGTKYSNRLFGEKTEKKTKKNNKKKGR